MDKIDKIIQGLSSIEKLAMFHTLQKELKRVPEYTTNYDEDGYYVKCDNPHVNSLRFEKKKYAELAYQVYKNMKPDEHLIQSIKYVFRLLNIDSEWTK